MSKKSHRSFTLIEFLVVTAVVGLMVSIVAVAINGARIKARDAKRKAELDQIRKALASYYIEEGQYPTTSGWISLEDTTSAEALKVRNALKPDYFSEIPEDPLYPQKDAQGDKYSYQYVATTTGNYQLCTRLEKGEYAYVSSKDNVVSYIKEIRSLVIWPNYLANPSWVKVADTVVRDIGSLSSDATTSKDIYCDDYNCIFWTDGAPAPDGIIKITEDSDVYGNILWAKTDNNPKTWADSKFSISGGDVGGTHPSGLTVGDNGVDVGDKNWLAEDYTSPSGTFDAMDSCKSKGEGWRLPTILEIDGIRTGYQSGEGGPYSDLPNIKNEYYFTSSEADADNAYILYFGSNGQVKTYTKDDGKYHRCVRGQ